MNGSNFRMGNLESLSFAAACGMYGSVYCIFIVFQREVLFLGNIIEFAQKSSDAIRGVEGNNL